MDRDTRYLCECSVYIVSIQRATPSQALPGFAASHPSEYVRATDRYTSGMVHRSVLQVSCGNRLYLTNTAYKAFLFTLLPILLFHEMLLDHFAGKWF